ncbi:OLC1v1030554C1 [Oldenlandia corymbosa var. corymbosa]|uniref:OLC1v1030554C1 n=1 Tax=Oldenlandia corymbosa var. corymbosa TaxID=529605 RepID=A0AAV1CI79_OLDCO|nr:OLC1v1030554C1 [Oldenlandia corymbosa var. corymbosa]
MAFQLIEETDDPPSRLLSSLDFPTDPEEADVVPENHRPTPTSWDKFFTTKNKETLPDWWEPDFYISAGRWATIDEGITDELNKNNTYIPEDCYEIWAGVKSPRKERKGRKPNNGKCIMFREGGFRMAVGSPEEEDELGREEVSDEEIAQRGKGLSEEQRRIRRMIRRGKRRVTNEARGSKEKPKRKPIVQACRNWPTNTGPNVGNTSGLKEEAQKTRAHTAMSQKEKRNHSGPKEKRGVDGLIRRRARRLFTKWARKVKGKFLEINTPINIDWPLAPSQEERRRRKKEESQIGTGIDWGFGGWRVLEVA